MRVIGSVLVACVVAGCGPGGGGGLPLPADLSVSLPDDLGEAPVDAAIDLGDDGGGGHAYDDLGSSDSGACVPPNVGAMCANPLPNGVGCQAQENCGPNGAGNHFDDDCNGQVDDICSCRPGDVQPCFLGPPGKHQIGACTDGTQTCQGFAEFGAWGPCVGSIGPSYERCDGLDNDCDGCVDDELCCTDVLACPMTVPDGAPFTDIGYDGTTWFKGTPKTWSWTFEGGPCDQLFKTTTGTPPTQSFTLSNTTTAKPTLHPTLSGDYKVTMTVVDTADTTFSCTFVQHVVGPGIRFELCWDRTGTVTQGGADLDLHVHQPGTTTNWFTPNNAGTPNPDDCNFYNCTANEYSSVNLASIPPPAWGYANSALAQCVGSDKGVQWQMYLNACHNPRLDVDNVSTIGRPENANIDNPKSGDTFRALVHYYGQDNAASVNPIEEHPIVNVYCAGRLVASYGQAPSTLGPCPGPTCFDRGTGWNSGLMWRVADVTAQVDLAGNTTGCAVVPIHPPGANAGYYVTNNVSSY
jgi:hypothetical protein